MNDNICCSQTALKLFTDWNEHGVRYCHWKSNEHLAEGIQGNTDLDILIDPSDADKANIYMIGNGFKRVISHKWKSYSGVEDWIGMDLETLVQTHLHIHYKLLTGLKNVKEQYLPWEQLVLDNVVRHKDYDICVCNPNIEVIILICRAAIKKDFVAMLKDCSFSKAEEQEYAYLSEKTDIDEINRFAKQILSDSTRNELLELVKNTDSKMDLTKFRKMVINDFSMYRRESRKSASFNYFRRFFLYKASKVIGKPIYLKKNFYTGGKLVSFIGVDGAGKTTLATYFAKWLSWKINCRYVYLGTGEGRSSFLNRIKKAIVMKRKKIGGSSAEGCVGEPKQIATPSIKKQLKMIALNYVCLSNDKYKYRTICKIFKMVNKGCIVVTDRYPQMQFDGIYDGMAVVSFDGNKILVALNEKIKQKETKIYKKICNVSPSIVIKLEIPVDVSVERKPCSGRALEQVKQKVEITKKIHFKDAKEYVMNSSGELGETKREVCKLLWELI